MISVAHRLALALLALFAAMVAIPSDVKAIGPDALLGSGRGLVAPATQSIDACYKRCFMDRDLGPRRFACRRACNATPAKKCQDRCYGNFPNSPRELKACLVGCGPV